MTDLPYLTATEAISAFRSHTLSPVELMHAVIDRCNDVNGVVNAITDEYFDRALQQARDAERSYMKNPDAARPLEGIPTAIKDTHDVAGELTTSGSVVHRNHRPAASAPTVDRLLAAGAIVHIRTTSPEFGHAPITKSPLWGVTRNPWNPAFSPGGSSGGAGAALASGMTTLADGSDGGGSIRIPASASGVFGYKPPWGRNPLQAGYPSEWLICFGSMARSVADAALMQNVMSGQHPEDLHTLRDQLVLPDVNEPVDGMRIAYSRDLGYFDVSTEVRDNTSRAANTFESLGCVVEEIDLGWTGELYDAWLTTWEGNFWTSCGYLLDDHRDELDPFVVEILERGSRVTLKQYRHANSLRATAYAEYARVLRTHDALIAPTLALPSVPADLDLSGSDLTIDGQPARDFTSDGHDGANYNSWVMCNPFNTLNTIPVASIPTGFAASSGVPTGMQIAGPAYDDLTVFKLAFAFEHESPWRGRTPLIDALQGSTWLESRT